MRRAGILVIAFALVAVLAVAAGGCSATEPAPESPAESTPAGADNDVAGTVWDGLTFDAAGRTQTVLPSAPILIEFGEDGTLSGNAGVNTYSTTYEVDGGSITIGPEIVTTKMAGPQDAMDQEANYLTTIVTAQSYQIDEDAGELVLFGPAQNTIARYKPAE